MRMIRECGRRGFDIICLLACFAALPALAQSNIAVLKTFGFAEHSARHPAYGAIEGSDGFFYGAATAGGRHIHPVDLMGYGIVYRIDPAGSNYTVLHHMNFDDGHSPSGLIEATDGFLYGTTFWGIFSNGVYHPGGIFRLQKDGAHFQMIHRFTFSTTNAAVAINGVVQGQDGSLYGASSDGGLYRRGTIYKLNRDGTGFRILHDFDGTNTLYPGFGLTPGGDGYLYGVSRGGVFRLDENGNDFIYLYQFPSGKGPAPSSPVIVAANGLLYGASAFGSAIYRLSPAGGAYTVIKEFSFTDGQQPSHLVQGRDGMLYGALQYTSSGFGLLFRIGLDGEDYTVLHRFTLSPGEGQTPSGLVFAGNGALYGTTYFGGNSSPEIGFYSGGTIFSLNTNGSNYSVLHSFDLTGGDGKGPNSMVRSPDGFFYGMTSSGGRTNSLGTVFRIRPDGSDYALIFNFRDPQGAVGGNASLINGPDGKLYGVAGFRDAQITFPDRIFRLSRDGSDFETLRVLDLLGLQMFTALSFATDGNLYGLLRTNSAAQLFKMANDGSGYAVLAQPASSGAAFSRRDALFQGADGLLYGAVSARTGLVFSVGLGGGQLATLHTFPSQSGDGVGVGALVQGSDDILYGITERGGRYDAGTIFRLQTSGRDYAILHHFITRGDGDGQPRLIEGRDGFLYGITAAGGQLGSVFRLARNGTHFAFVHVFDRSQDKQPWGPAALLEGDDDSICVLTHYGGPMDLGTFSKIIKPPEIISVAFVNAFTLRITALAPSGRTLALESSPDFNSWMPVASAVSANGAVSFDTIPEIGQSMRFYRLAYAFGESTADPR